VDTAKLIVLTSALAIHATLAVEDGIAPPPLAQGHIRSIALDAAGNRYVTGFFFGEVDFNPGAGIDAKISAGEADLFLTRFNADGSHAWTRTFGGSADDQAAAVAVAGSSVFVAGRFASADAGVPNAGGIDTIVLAFQTARGAPVTTFGNKGAQTFGGAGDDEATAIVIAAKTLYVAGGYTSANATVGGEGKFASVGEEDAFVFALNTANGKRSLAFGKDGVQTLAGLGIERATGLAFAGRTLFVTGYVFASSTGIGKLGVINGLGGLDAFVMAIDRKSGKPAKNFGTRGIQLVGGTGNDLAFGAAAANGHVHVCGTFGSSDAGVGGLGQALSVGGFDAFVATLNSITGAAHPFFGISGLQTFGGSQDDSATAITAVGERLDVVGAFASNNAGIGGYGATASAGGSDAFALQLDAFTGGAFDFAPVTFGGSADDAAFGLAAAGSAIFAGGASFSQNAGIDGAGTLDAVAWNGFLLSLEAGANDAANLDASDSDGDDFPDEVEAALGTPSDSFILSPAGFHAGLAGPLTVRSLALKLSFATPDPARDTVALRGRVAIPAGFASAGEPVVVSVGGVVRRFVLNSQGVAANRGNAFRIAVKKTRGQVLAQEASFTAIFSRSSLRTQLDDEQLTGEATIARPGAPRGVAVLVLIGGKFFREDVTVNYAAIAGRSGLATTP
jgi:hypothetical protein